MISCIYPEPVMAKLSYMQNLLQNHDCSEVLFVG